MADRNFSINVSIDGDSLSLQNSLKATNAALNSLRKDLGDLDRALGGTVGAIRSVRDSARSLAVDLGLAERATQSYTRFIREARDAAGDLAREMKESALDVEAMGFASSNLAAAQDELAKQLRVTSGAIAQEGDGLGRLAALLTGASTATDDLARSQQAGVIAAEAEAAAISDVGDAAVEAAAKMEVMRAASDGAGGSAGRAFIDRGALFHRGTGFGLPRFLGGAVVGAFGAGGLLPMTGIGPERFVTGAASLAGSAVGAVGGLGVEALGAGGTMAVGGGSDMAVMKSTISDTSALFKTLQTNQQNVAQAQAQVNAMVAQYGAHSKQAASAQLELARAQARANETLKLQMAALGPGASAELALAKNVDALNKMWDQVTGTARKSAVSILDQVVGLGHDYVGKVADAAAQNLAIINNDIKPLFAWLEGPQGMGIWNDLENKFKADLPAAIDLFTNSVEFLLRSVDVASTFTGHFITHLDDLSKHLRDVQNSRIESFFQKLIVDMDTWGRFLHAAGRALSDLFRTGANEGLGLLNYFTELLDRFDRWARSVQGSEWLHNFFQQRTQELMAILQILPPIIQGFGRFYMALQPLVPVWTAIANAIADVVKYLSQVNPAATTALAGVILFRKYLDFGAIGARLGVSSAAGAAAGGLGGGAGTALSSAGTAEATAIESATVGGLAGAFGKARGIIDKYGPLMKAGLIFWTGSAIVSGLEAGFGSDANKYLTNFGDRLGFGLQKALSSFTFGLSDKVLKLLPFGQLESDKIRGMKQDLGAFSTTLKEAFSTGTWDNVRGVLATFASEQGPVQAALLGTRARVDDLMATVGNLTAVSPQMAQKIVLSFNQISGQGGSAIVNMKSTVAQNMDIIRNDIGTNTLAGKEAIELNFKAAADFMSLHFRSMGVSTQQALTFIKQQTEASMTFMEHSIGTHSSGARQILATNFLAAEQNMEAEYSAMGISTSKAMQAINGFLISALKSLGVSVPSNLSLSTQQLNILLGGISSGVSGALGQGASGLTGAPPPGVTLQARGGILGNPNAPGQDMYHVVMGEGEAVVTRHQRAALDSMLPAGASVAGVIGSITKPNYASSGLIAGEPAHAASGLPPILPPGGANAPPPATGYVYPVSSSMTFGTPWRPSAIDQGVDFGGAGDILSIGQAIVDQAPSNSGWPGGGWILYHLTSGPRAGQFIYNAENIQPVVGIGASLSPGQVIAHAPGTPPYTELGFADAGGSPLGAGQPHDSSNTAGQAFAAFVQSLPHSLTTGAFGIGGGGASGAPPLPPKPTIKDFKVAGLGSGLLDNVAQGAVEMYRKAAQSYVDAQYKKLQATRVSTAGPAGPTGFSGTPSAPGFTITGPVSTFGPPGEAAGSTAYGRSSADPGISLRIPGTTFGDSRNRGLMGHTFRVSIAGHTANLMDIDLGPAEWTGRDIDVTGAGVAAMGIPYGSFPTGAIGTATLIAAMGRIMGAPDLQTYARYKKPPKVPTTPKTHRSKHSNKIKHIPALPGLNPGFSYFFDQDAIWEPILDFAGITGKPNEYVKGLKAISYPGGNSAALQHANDNYSLLQGILGLIDDTDPTSGGYLSNGKYVYGSNHFYPGDPANPKGFVGAWKLDQQIAAQLGILQMMTGEDKGAKGELSRLGKYVRNTSGQLTALVGRGGAEVDELAGLEKYIHHLRYKRSQQDFAAERLRIHEKFTRLRANLTVGGIGQTASLTNLYGRARSVIEDERRWMLSGIDPNLASKYRGNEVAAINNQFGDKLAELAAIRTNTSATDRISMVKAREFLSLSEQDALFAVTDQQHGFTKKAGAANWEIYNLKQSLATDKEQARIIMNDLLGAKADSVTGKMSAGLLKLGIDRTLSPSFGGNDIYSEITQRMVDLENPAQGIPYFKFVAIPSLEKNRNAIAGTSATGAASNTELISLLQQQATFNAADFAVAKSQMAALLGFTPLLGQMVGSFAGGGVIPETGYALVHRHETITPDPQGPYGHMTTSTTRGGDTHVVVELSMKGGMQALAPFIEAVVHKTAPKVVNRELGRRQRMLSGAPGGYGP